MSVQSNHPLCRSCGTKKVLKAGDYCRDCALKWDSPTAYDRYIIVEPSTVEDTAQFTGLGLTYLRAKMDETFERNCTYVVFQAFDCWQEITINNRFHIPTVMNKLLERLIDDSKGADGAPS